MSDELTLMALDAAEKLRLIRWEREHTTRDRSVRELRKPGAAHRIVHRYGWPGGLSFYDLMNENITRNNALFKMLRRAG